MDPEGNTDLLMRPDVDVRCSRDIEAPLQVYTAVLYDDSSESSSMDELDVGEEKSPRGSSLCMGLLVGCYIQLSSLGGNFMLHELGCQRVVTFSLAWSFFTSGMGVSILYYLGQLLPSEKHRISIECYFAMGALLGVCLSWIVTDFTLGVTDKHMIQSMLTLCGALAWCQLMTCGYQRVPSAIACDEDDESEVSGLSKPLLAKSNPSRDHARVSMIMGWIIGLYIQFSSLGANFMFDMLFGSAGTRQGMILFSLVWSICTSSMGGLLFALVRSIAPHIHRMEGWYCGGALLGVNLAWIVTDLVLGVNGHIVYSLGSLLLTALWCKTASYCNRNV